MLCVNSAVRGSSSRLSVFFGKEPLRISRAEIRSARSKPRPGHPGAKSSGGGLQTPLFGQIMPSAGRFGLRGLFLRLRGRAVVGGILRGEGLLSRRRVDSMRQLPAVLQLKREVALPPYAQKRG
jgi:hypothetical protein